MFQKLLHIAINLREHVKDLLKYNVIVKRITCGCERTDETRGWVATPLGVHLTDALLLTGKSVPGVARVADDVPHRHTGARVHQAVRRGLGNRTTWVDGNIRLLGTSFEHVFFI